MFTMLNHLNRKMRSGGNYTRYKNSTKFSRTSRKKSTARVSTFTRRKRPRRSYKSKGSRRTKRSTVTKLSKRVSKLSHEVGASLGKLTHRNLFSWSLTVDQNKSLTHDVVISARGQVAQPLKALPFYVAATNSIQVVDATLGGFQREYQFTSTSVKCVLRNNYRVPVQVRSCFVVPKSDTGVGPTEAFEDGLLDAGLLDPESSLIRWSDSQVYTDLWRSISGSFKDVILLPGEQILMSTNLGSFDYQIATTLEDTQTYRVADKPISLMVQIRGIIAHDSVDVTQHGLSGAALDISLEVIRKITYNAGASIERSVLLDQTTDFSNSAIVAATPAAALQSFAIS